MHIYGTDGHHLLPVSLAQVPQQQRDQVVQHAYLFLIVILQFSGGFCNTIESLGNAGRVLAHLPLNEDSSSKSDSVSEIIPTYFDLAISRLQSKTDE